MKRIGMLGGMSWESSLVYYKIINETIKENLGGFHSADLIMYSFDFDLIERLQRQNQWALIRELVVEEAMNLKKSGAEFIVIASNTMHIMAQAIEKETGLQVLHIGKVTARAVKNKGLEHILLLGTEYTMKEKFYTESFEALGIDLTIPEALDRAFIHKTIFKELVKGTINPLSRLRLIEIIEKYPCQGLVLACTELSLLIKEGHVSIPVFDTTQIHAQAAAYKSLFSEDMRR